MNAAVLASPVELPEWRRSGHFFALAVALHAAVLFYPLRQAIEKLDPPPLRVQLVEPPKPLTPLAPPPPQPVAKEVKRDKTPPRPQRQVLAVASETAVPSSFSVPVVSQPAPPAPAAVAAAPSPAAAVVATPARFDAAYLNNPRPAYPPLSRRLGEEGKVLLRVRVAADGHALTVDVDKSSNFPRLDEAARQAVSRWRFVPARRGDEAVEATVIVPMVFRLDE
ncbi:energy transducer TonB [Dechloromonas sp. ZY10]|uniref:energy transducer TonB n=1 Tax=Dechloromonas aquae TaxID=2664436 RepID=UPI003528072F